MTTWKATVGITVIVGTGLVALSFLLREASPQRPGTVNHWNGRSPAGVQGARPLVPVRGSTAGISSKNFGKGPFYRAYFTRHMLGNPSVSSLYYGLSKNLPRGQAGDLISVYIAEGIARNGSREFSRFMASLSSAIAKDSGPIARTILGKMPVFKSDPFVYEMMLNLAATLNVGTDVKARILGVGLETPFQSDEAGHISWLSANIANALILMKNSGITSDQAMPFIQSGLAMNREDPAALRAYTARVNTYYPGAAGN